ncbi:hypothetical protein BB560_000969 [Smittium megazygosporum]|uniref:Uncharacterized protein n=1 Tax=Smittium megazygosporum TaxID=133381 RepID=A0A2T9ZIW9_9FUNG|nr:hypothetical protein BB560_000969 [Smittium megazygosporum]
MKWYLQFFLAFSFLIESEVISLAELGNKTNDSRNNEGFEYSTQSTFETAVRRDSIKNVHIQELENSSPTLPFNGILSGIFQSKCSEQPSSDSGMYSDFCENQISGLLESFDSKREYDLSPEKNIRNVDNSIKLGKRNQHIFSTPKIDNLDFEISNIKNSLLEIQKEQKEILNLLKQTFQIHNYNQDNFEEEFTSIINKIIKNHEFSTRTMFKKYTGDTISEILQYAFLGTNSDNDQLQSHENFFTQLINDSVSFIEDLKGSNLALWSIVSFQSISEQSNKRFNDLKGKFSVYLDNDENFLVPEIKSMMIFLSNSKDYNNKLWNKEKIFQLSLAVNKNFNKIYEGFPNNLEESAVRMIRSFSEIFQKADNSVRNIFYQSFLNKAAIFKLNS